MIKRRPPLQIDRFKVALNPGDKLACCVVPQGDNTAAIEKASLFLKDLDTLAVRHGYQLEGYGRLDMFVAMYAAEEEEPLMRDRPMDTAKGDRPLPRPGEMYRHFKGHDYFILAVTTRPSEFDSFMAGVIAVVGGVERAIWEAQNPDTGEVICFSWEESTSLKGTCDSKEIQDPLVIYGDMDRIWARPLENFLETIHSDDGTNFYRFERVFDECDCDKSSAGSAVTLYDLILGNAMREPPQGFASDRI